MDLKTMALVFVFFVGAAAFPETAADHPLPKVEILSVAPDTQHVIDGRLAEDFWRQCAALPIGRIGADDAPSSASAIARVASDGRWLYAAFEIADDASPSAAKQSAPNAGLARRGRVELYLDPDPAGDKCYRWLVDQSGNRRADVVSGPNVADFPMHWRAAAAATDTGWSVEMALPLFYFVQGMSNGGTWRANFCLVGNAPLPSGSWAPVKRTFAERANFGFVSGVPADPPPVFAPRLAFVLAGPTTDQTGEYVSLVRIGLANDAPDAAGNLRLVMRDESVPAQPLETATNLVWPAGVAQQVIQMELRRPLEFVPRPQLTASLEDGLGQWTQAMAHGEGQAPEQFSGISIWFDRSYYTREQEAVLYVEALAGLRADPTAFAVCLKDDRAQMVWQGAAECVAPGVWRAAIPIADLPPAAYQAEMVQGGAAPAAENLTAVLVKRPPAPTGNEVKVDCYNRCLLLNNEPFFPFGVCWMPARSAEEDLAQLAALGFNTVIRWTGYGSGATNSAASLIARLNDDALLAAAEKHNIKVVEYPAHTRGRDENNARVWRFVYPRFVENYGDWKTNDLPAVISAIGPRPSVLAYLAMDEPADVGVQPGNVSLREILNDMLGTIAFADPYHPVFLNFGGMLPARMEWLNRQSFFASFNYWRVAADSRETAARLAVVLAHNAGLAEKYRRPLWLMPTVELNWSAQALPMDAADSRAQLYLLLIHGAKGINYFCWPWKHAATDAWLAELAGETRVLAPALLRRRPAQAVVYDRLMGKSGIYAALLADADDVPLLMLLNAGTAPITFCCRLPWLGGAQRLESLFDASSTECRNGEFICSLAPCATRVYRIADAAITNVWQTHLLALESADRQDAEKNESAVAGNLIRHAEFADLGGWNVRDRDRDRVSVADLPEDNSRVLTLQGGTGGGLYVRSKPFGLKTLGRYRLAAAIRYGGGRGQPVTIALRGAADTNSIASGLVCGDPALTGWQCVNQDLLLRSDQPVLSQLVIYWNAPAGGTAEIKDLSLMELDAAMSGGKNRIPNSSFEAARLPNWPDYWEPRAPAELFVRRRLGTAAAPWGMDADRPFHGRYSLRIEPGIEETVSTPRQRAHFGVPAEEGRTFVFSAWVRADADDAKIRIALRGLGSHVFAVGKQWTRVEFSGVKTNPLNDAYRNFTTVSFSSSNTVWVDAVQLEEGAQATEYVE